MNVRELYTELNRQIPPSLSCEWDNDGLMLLPNGEREVHRALITLDVTPAAARDVYKRQFVMCEIAAFFSWR